MEWESAKIRETFFEVINDAKKLNKSQMEKKYEEFSTKFKKLYEMAIESVVKDTVQESVKMLDMMLTQRENMKKGKISELNAGLLVGNQLGHKYIYPKTNVPSQEDYKKAIDQINTKVKEEGGISN